MYCSIAVSVNLISLLRCLRLILVLDCSGDTSAFICLQNKGDNAGRPDTTRIFHNCRTSFLQVLTPADDIHHINKHNFKVPFVCGCRDLGEALRRIAEGAAMIRTKGEAGTGNVVEAVRHTRSVTGAIRQLQTLDDDELYVYAKEIRAPVELVRKTKHLGRCV